ncbi:MAG: CHAT domain-containing protein [Anaerolineales bacterium]
MPLSTDYADLELSFRRGKGNSYAVELRFNQPGSDAEIRLGQGETISVHFDQQALLATAFDPAAYGKLLSDSLFADKELLTGFQQARASAGTTQKPLRVRLLIDPGASELNKILWETMRDPQNNGNTLFTGEDILFSRYLSSTDWHPVKLRAKGNLKALVAIASPSNLKEYQLAEIKVEQEVEHAQTSLDDMPIAVLATGEDERCSLDAIVKRLREEYDILYLVAHGAFVDQQPWLLLEEEDGRVATISGQDLVNFIQDMKSKPRLIVLASCQSAGDGAGRALQALGPRLAEAGVPAIIAMQGNVSMDTLTEFMPVFFSELQKDGQIDRAMSVARGAVRNRNDFWMPVLFMRLKSGRIWYVPGFGEGHAFRKWNALVAYIKDKSCTPILGPGLYEPLLGSLGDIAQRWAKEFRYPLSPSDTDSLPRVAQYLTIDQSPQFPYQHLQEFMIKDIASRFGYELPRQLLDSIEDTKLDEFINFIGVKRRERHPDDSYKLLAQLPYRIYVTTNLNSLLESTLEEAGREPYVILAPWNPYTEEKMRTLDPNYEPDPQRPLVYHLFGRLAEPKSVVLTEDNYFDYLLGVSRNNDLIPGYVRNALRNNSLLFIGFRMDEWNFRILFRSIVDKKTELMNEYVHMAAQVEPEEGRIIDPEGARRYLEEYFKHVASINLYWGTAEEFVKELWNQWNALR